MENHKQKQIFECCLMSCASVVDIFNNYYTNFLDQQVIVHIWRIFKTNFRYFSAVCFLTSVMRFRRNIIFLRKMSMTEQHTKILKTDARNEFFFAPLSRSL